MKITAIILAAALLLTGTAPVVSTFGVQPATAQVSAPTAGLISSQPSFMAGTPATFSGLGFSPGEPVTFRVTRFDDVPVTGGNHTPASVVADPNGAFAAIWPACATDCAGKLLRIEAIGQTSGKVAHAMFMDLPAPTAPGTQGQQVHRAGGMANRLPDNARAILDQAAVAPTFERIKSFGTPGVGAFPQAGLLQGADGALYGIATQGGASGFGTVFKMNPDGTGNIVLKSFDYSLSGGFPNCGLTQGTDGALYGMATYGGTIGFGTVFKLNTDGTGFTVLQNFDYSTTGGYPNLAPLTQGTDGALYGTTSQGGTGSQGTVFKLNTDGTGFTVLQNFDYFTTGGNVSAGLMEGTDGALYGVAQQGGTFGSGTVFKLNTDGSGFTVLQNLDYSTTGGNPFGATLMQGADGALYGTAASGGTFGTGTAFKLSTDGTGFTVIRSFDYFSDGGYPFAGLIQGADGALYGTTSQAGPGSYGTAFKLNTDGSDFTVLKSFDYSTSGAYLYAGLIQGTDGALYGTAYQGGTNGVGTVFTLNTDGTGFSVVKNLSYGADQGQGAYAFAGLTEGTDGMLYGTTIQGGTFNAGVVFKMNKDGTGFAVLQHFNYSTVGAYLYGGLMQGTDGALYGAAYQGGTFGAGTLFKLNTDGTGFTVLRNFNYLTEAGYPYARLIQGTDGALYGTASQGNSNAGAVFKVNTDGTGFTVLKNFNYSTDGGYLYSGLVQGTDGALYGTTSSGGASSYGTLYKLNTDGTGFTVLKNFNLATSGGYLYAGLMQGTDGALYGAAYLGGIANGGTLFKLNPDGSGFTVLQNFDYTTNGGQPYGSGLTQGADGALYGTTEAGTGGAGNLFMLNPDGTGFTVLKNFNNGADGGYSYGILLQGTDGNLYGVTYQGGDAGLGTVYRLLLEGNDPPVAMCKDVMLWAGAGCTAAASIDDGSYDPDAGDTITLAQSPAGPYPIGATAVTLTVTDNNGASSSCMATVTVTNPAPVATITGPGSGSVFPVNAVVSFTGTWTDANGGVHTARWTFDGVPDAPFPAGTGTSGAANTSHTFTTAGVYMVSLTVTDECDSAGTANQVGGVDAMVVIYDPNAGFVTGGGWINSPAGAYTADPLLTGKANFGFVSKYKKGASVPTGETEFQYKVGNLNFHSTSYQWLVVAGAKAQFKGSGTINGAGSYGFMLTATDGQVAGGGGQDKFRMKITQSGGGLVYDNLLGAPDSEDPTTVLGGGSIVIHTGGNSMSADAGTARDEAGGATGLSALPTEFALSQNHPNPFDRNTMIAFSLPERSRISLVVYDLVGREVRTLADGEWQPGRHSATLARTGADGGRLGAGVYFVRLNARSLESERSFSSLRKMVVVK